MFQKAKVGTPAVVQEMEGIKTTGRSQRGMCVLSLFIIFHLILGTRVFVIKKFFVVQVLPDLLL